MLKGHNEGRSRTIRGVSPFFASNTIDGSHTPYRWQLEQRGGNHRKSSCCSQKKESQSQNGGKISELNQSIDNRGKIWQSQKFNVEGRFGWMTSKVKLASQSRRCLTPLTKRYIKSRVAQWLKRRTWEVKLGVRFLLRPEFTSQLCFPYRR